MTEHSWKEMQTSGQGLLISTVHDNSESIKSIK